MTMTLLKFSAVFGAAYIWTKNQIPKKFHDFDEIINRYAEHYGIETALIKAHMMQESSFNPDALRDEGKGRYSVGLLQILYPTTAIALKQGVTKEELFDPETNINLSVKLMKELKQRYPNNFKFRIVSYNSGRPKYKKDSQELINEYYFNRVFNFYLIFKAAELFGL